MNKYINGLLLTLLFNCPALAGGLALYETSPDNSASANAGSAAKAQGPSTIAGNPAGMALLDGTQIQLSAGVVSGDMTIKLDNGGVSGGNPVQTAPLGTLYVTHALDERWSAGIGLFGSHGLGLNYEPEWEGSRYVQYGNITGIVMAPSLALRINPQWSVGMSLIASQGKIEMKSTPLPNMSSAARLDFSANDWAYAASLGVIYEKDENTRIGLNYVSESEWRLKGNLFPGADIPQESQINIVMPQSLTLSGYHQLNEQWVLLGSINWQQWSRFGEMDISHPKFSTTKNLGYQDTWHASIGTQFSVSDKLRISTGIAYDSSPVNDVNRTVNIPVGKAWRFGLGGDYQIVPSTTIELGYTFVRIGDMPFEQPGISGVYENNRLHFVMLGLKHKF
ncbi:OmpP1/FadL family transporter [Morganella psychrotolerans]|uniref:OmpP1/FadL family transporter n=1 Tax=Morganella psychrotolerans TaxID=368603 RepID=UPI0039B0789A